MMQPFCICESYLKCSHELYSTYCVLQVISKMPPFCLFTCHVPCWFQSVGRVNFLLRSSWHSVLQTSALGHCVQACNTAKGEKKRYSRRQVRCNFNLKLKAPLTACFQLRGPAKRESKRGIEREMSGAMQRSGRQTERVCWREEWEHKERTVRVWETEGESKARGSEKRGKNTCQPSSSERWVQ